MRQAVELADVVFGNASEEIVPLAGCERVAASRLSGRRRTVVARLGAEGAFAVTADVLVQAPAFPVSV